MATVEMAPYFCLFLFIAMLSTQRFLKSLRVLQSSMLLSCILIAFVYSYYTYSNLDVKNFLSFTALKDGGITSSGSRGRTGY
jgi:hypothetical protein